MSLVQRFFRFAGTGTPPHSLRLGLAGVLALALSLPLAPRPASAQPDTAIAPRRYYGPAPRRVYRGAPAWSPEWYAYCARKYRSFNPRTGYYLAYSGRYRFCR
eukprot:jgi/Tetstr1/465457/TSEL_010141.t1